MNAKPTRLCQLRDVPRANGLPRRCVEARTCAAAVAPTIAEAVGDIEKAEREYETCLQLRPGYVEAAISLASLAADHGQIERATEFLERAQRMAQPPLRVISNLRAKVALARGDIAGARTAVNQALGYERDIPNLDLAARIELEAVTRNEANCGDASDVVRQYAAEIDLAGAHPQAERLLERLNQVCG